MSADATGWVIRHSPYKGATYTAHVMIADTVNDANGNEFWMSVAKLADKGRMQRGTAGGALAAMVDDGFVTLLEERPGGTNRYRFEFLEVAVIFESREKTQLRADGRKVRADRAACSDEGARLPIGGCAPGAQEVRAEQSGGARSARTNPKEPNANVEENPSLAIVPLSAAPTTLSDKVDLVFAEWKETVGKTGQTVLNPERRRLIRQALAEYPLEDVIDAVRGWRHSAWHTGDNPGRVPYDELKYTIGDADKIEKFRDLERNKRPAAATVPEPETWKTLRAMNLMGNDR